MTRREEPARFWGRAWILALVFALIVQPLPAAAADGGGVAGDPYIIRDQADLEAIPTLGMDKHYKLAGDITLNGNWKPIGTAGSPFTGHFDGDGHTISGLNISITTDLIFGNMVQDSEHAGLFGYAQNAVIENVTLDAPTVNYDGLIQTNKTGALLGSGVNTIIRNVHVNGGSVSGVHVVGGLAGKLARNSEIRESSSYADIGIVNWKPEGAGGLVGVLNGSAVHDSAAGGDVNIGTAGIAGGLAGMAEAAFISGSTAAGEVSGQEKIGGLIGESVFSTIENSSASGKVTAKSHAAGGLIGYSAEDTISGSSASGQVDGSDKVGGLAGHVTAGTFSDVSASGDVNGTNEVGGLIGHLESSVVESGSASGNVFGSLESVGGLIGYSFGDQVTDSQASGNVGGPKYVGGLIGHAEFDTIKNNRATGQIHDAYALPKGTAVGGLIGKSVMSGIEGNSASGGVYGANTVGGLIGHSSQDTITDNHASGAVAGESTVGGLIGHAESSKISDVYATGQVNGIFSLAPDVGGLIGQMEGGFLYSAYATGAVYGQTNVGGLVGGLAGGDIHLAYASGTVDGAYEVGGLVGTMDSGSVSTAYADGSINGFMTNNMGGLIGLMNNGTVFETYAAKISTGSPSSSGGLIAAKQSGTVESSYYLASSGLANNGIGESKTAVEMVLESTYEGWDFETIWQLDERANSPQLVGIERTQPAIKAAVVRDDSPDVLEIAFYEPVVIDQDALDHLQVTVDDEAVSFTGMPGEKRWLLLKLERAVAPLQKVEWRYDSAHPIFDRSGNKMESAVKTAENLVTSSLGIQSVSPANGAKNVPAATNLTLTFSSAVTPVAGKTITIRKLFGGMAVETVSVTDAAKVTVSGAQVTVNPETGLSDSTVYYVQVEAGAFRDAANNLSPAVTGSNEWRFETGVDADKQWIDAANGLTDAKGGQPSLFADGDAVYVAYSDKDHDGKLTVMKLDNAGRTWQPVGTPGFTAGKAEQPSLYVEGGIPYAVFMDGSQSRKATVMKYDDETGEWVVVGSAGLSEGVIDAPSLAVHNGKPYVAYEDAANDNQVIVKTYDAIAGWKSVGNLPVSEDVGYWPSLQIHEGKLYVAYQDYMYTYGFGATVMQYDSDANAWNPVGERGFTPGFAFETRLFADGDRTLFAAYKNDDYEAELMMFDELAGEWVPVGTSFSAGQVYGIDLFVADGDPYVVYEDAENGNRAAVMKFTGSSWVQVGEPVSSGNSDNPSIVVAEGVPYVAFAGGNDLFVKKYGTESGSGGGDDDNPGGDDGPGDGDDDNPGSGGSPSPGNDAPATDGEPANGPDDGFSVIVDGKEQGHIAKRSESEQGGRRTVTVTVDADKLIEQLHAEQDGFVIQIPVASETDQVSAVLTAEAVKAMESRQVVLVIETNHGNYRLPAADLLVEQAAAAFGGQVNLADVVVTIEVAKGSEEQAGQLRQIAEESGFTVVVPPVVFTVKVSHAGMDLEIERFAAFVQREIPIPARMEPGAVTTAVVLEQDGSVRHVPTYITQRDGVWYAVVNSLTNSAYSLVYYEAHFADMDGHWAASAVHNLASRKIVAGVGGGRFLPDAPVSRAAFAALLVRALGLPERQGAGSFKDVGGNDWLAGSTATSSEYGLVKGYADGTFRPSETMTREAAMVMIVRAMKLAGMDAAVSGEAAESILSAFPDGQSVIPWAKQAVASAVDQGIAVGSPAGLQPQEAVTRAEAVMFIRRMLRAANLID